MSADLCPLCPSASCANLHSGLSGNQPLFRCLSPPGEVKQEGGSVFREGTPYQRRGSLQLWQFLVALLDDPGNAHFIAWTGRGMEFKLIEPEEVSFCGKVSSFRASALGRGSGTDGDAALVYGSRESHKHTVPGCFSKAGFLTIPKSRRPRGVCVCRLPC